MGGKLSNKRVAILATDRVEQAELLEPKKTLEAAGATTEVISPKTGKIKSWNHTNWGVEIPVETLLISADPKNYDAREKCCNRLAAGNQRFHEVHCVFVLPQMVRIHHDAR